MKPLFPSKEFGVSYLDEAPAGTPADIAPADVASQPGQYLVPDAYRKDVEQLFGILEAQIRKVSDDLEECHVEGLEALGALGEMLTTLQGRVGVLEERLVIAEAETEFRASAAPWASADSRFVDLAEEWLRRA